MTLAIESMRRELEGRPFVEAFAADLSHELKNPVAAIRASAEVLADGALEEPEEAARFVGRIQESVARIERLLGDLLSLARIEARGVEQAPRVDLDSLLREASARAAERGGSVDLLAPERPERPEVRGDAAWLGRALDNLLDNARAHGRPTGPTRLELRREVSDWVISVRNPGEVSALVAPRMFRRFVTSRADRGGSGLGLAIVRAVADAHRGSVECAALGPPEVEFLLRLPAS